MAWVTLEGGQTNLAPRPLFDLDISQPELFGCVIEGICPGCRGRLEIRPVKVQSQTYAESCGWCSGCLWGWSATVYRGTEQEHLWHDGEKLVTVYAQGALA